MKVELKPRFHARKYNFFLSYKHSENDILGGIYQLDILCIFYFHYLGQSNHILISVGALLSLEKQMSEVELGRLDVRSTHKEVIESWSLVNTCEARDKPEDTCKKLII